MGKYFKSLKDQIQEFNDFFKENTIIVLSSILFSIIPSITVNSKEFDINALTYGTSVLIVIFLLWILFYQMYIKFEKHKFNETNWVMLLFMILLMFFSIGYIFNAVTTQNEAVLFSTLVITGSISVGLAIFSIMIIPQLLIIAIYIYFEEISSIKARFFLTSLLGILTISLTPSLIYRYNSNLDIFILISSIFISLIGVMIIMANLIKFGKYLMKIFRK